MTPSDSSGPACERPGQGPGGLPSPAIDLPVGDDRTPHAVFAGGCFWCVEAVFEQIDGVLNVVSGYAGGSQRDADYQAVSSGATDHAEVVQVTYDPARVSYGQLLRVFFATHDPTTRDRQGPDTGPQYRSAIFYAEQSQRRVAEAYIRQLEASGVFANPIVTTLEPLEAFYEAEEYHQDFVRRQPAHPYVRAIALPKVEKARQQFAT